MIFKYTFKFTGLAFVFSAILYLIWFVYLYLCKATPRITHFITTLIKLPKLKIFGFKITNYFSILDAFMVFIIGVLYFLIAIVFLLALIFVATLGSVLMATIF